MSMTSIDVLNTLDEIAANSSRAEKERILGENINTPLMREVVKSAYDSFITYGVKPKQPKAANGSEVFQIDTVWLWTIVHKLANRELTGGDAKTAIDEAFNRLDAKSAELFWRILNKDLRCGITAKTVNAVLPGTIPVFEVMLSKVYEEKRIKTWPVGVEPKMDGMRAMILVKDGKARAFSRVGNHIPALDYLSDEIAQTVTNAIDATAKISEISDSKLADAYFRMLGGDSRNPTVAIDCEAISNGDFYDGGLKRKDEDATDVILHVFDAVPYRLLDAPEREIPLPFKLRRRFAEFIVKSAPAGAPLRMTNLRYAQSHDEIMKITEDHWRNGLEGSMVKLLDGHYVKTKGHIWMKIKKEETLDLRVVGWFEGKEGTTLEGKFGGFLVDHKGVIVRVGGGFKADEREAFLEPCKNLIESESVFDNPAPGETIGRLIEVEYHEVTPDGSLRHPRFIRFRDDKDKRLRAA